MAKIKSDAIYNNVLEKVKSLDCEKVLSYKQSLLNNNDYNNFETRFANDILKACVPSSEICNWYIIYNVTDKHITSLAVKICKELNYL